MAIIIRRASIDDARAIAELQLRAWRRAYADIVDARHLEAWDGESRTAHWEQHATSTLVAASGGVIHAFASIGPSREDDAAVGEGEVYALYVDPAAQGAGLGTVLLAAVQEALRADGCARARLRVLARNGLARAFYEGCGWTLVAGREEPHDWGPHVLYRRDL